ncbi:MAG TPA: TetR/AcrR family transcriptional regulator [Micromonosporaceae bacterium]
MAISLGSTTADLDHLWTEIQPEVVRRLMIAATQEFSAIGYHATTTRGIAGRAGLSPAGVYVHFRSKEEVLYRISLIGHQHSLGGLLESIDGVVDPTARLRAMVAHFSAWHARNHVPARVIQYELGALSEDHFAEIAVLRREIETTFRSTLEYGVSHGVFDVPDIGGAALALISLALDLPRWYRTGGPRTPEDIGALHAELAERMFRRS